CDAQVAPAFLLFLATLCSVAGAQAPPLRSTARPIQWWEAALVLGGIALSSTLDEWTRDAVQRSRTPATDDAADVFRHMGQPEVWATVPAVMFVAGTIDRNPELR